MLQFEVGTPKNFPEIITKSFPEIKADGHHSYSSMQFLGASAMQMPLQTNYENTTLH